MPGVGFFHFDPFYVVLATIGACILLAFWLPRFLRDGEPAASFFLLLFGAAVFAFVPRMPVTIDPLQAPEFWEITSEFAVIAALFGSGLRIDTKFSLDRFAPTLRLLVVAMPLTIAAVALFGWAVAGLGLGAAIILGAALSPTDPVLAGDLQVGPPQQGREHPVRYLLTTEAGLNDGLAFPFVYLGVLVVTSGFTLQSFGLEWLARDVVYRLAVGLAFGAGAGWLIARVIFDFPRHNRLADKGAGIVAVAVLLFTYGGAQLLEGYGFVSVFVAGLMLRRAESDHAFHRKLHDFSEATENALSVFLLILLGGALPHLLASLTWQLAAIAVVLVFVIRPIVGWLSLTGSSLRGGNRWLVAFYGVRGIGSIYYIAFACAHLQLKEEPQLWTATAFCIFLSTMVHGLTSGFVDRRLALWEDRQEARLARRAAVKERLT